MIAWRVGNVKHIKHWYMEESESNNVVWDKSDELRYVQGKYLPAFFEMQLETNDAIDPRNLNADQLSTFLHEYIHFLQDFNTTYGLYKIYAIGECILSCVKQIKDMPLGDFDTPIDFEQENQDNVQLQMDVLDLTAGETDDAKQRFDQIRINKIEKKNAEIRKNEVITTIEQVVLHTDKGDLLFGAREIMESMAYMIQCSCYPETPKHYDFPYNTAFLVANYYSTSFAHCRGKVIALCEMSLMTSNPGKVFVQIMEEVQGQQKRLKFVTTTDVYIHFEDIKLYNYQTKRYQTVLDSYRDISNFAFLHLIEYYRGEPRFDDIIKWLKLLQDFSMRKKKTSISIFKEIMNSGPVSQNKILADIINTIGGPLMKNNVGGYYQFPNVPNLSMITAVKTIYKDVFTEGHNTCGLHAWCLKTPNNNATNNCYLSPWSRCESPDTMCPFSALWRKWGLSGHNPV